MAGRRIVWALCVLLAGALFVLADNVGTLSICVLVVVLPVLAVGVAAVQSKRLRVSLHMPLQLQQGEDARCSIQVHGRIAVPVCMLRADLLVKNLFADDESSYALQAVVGRQGSCCEVSVETMCCGTLVASLREVRLCDPFGLSAWRFDSPEPTKTLVQPQEFLADVVLAADEENVPESNDYSMLQAGNDPSETYSLREYQPGDPIKNVHWKLSQKTDKLIVRELGLPIADAVLLFFENTLPEHTARGQAGPRVLEAMAATFLSLSRAMVREGVEHELAWLSDAEGLKRSTVTTENDVDAASVELLGEPVRRRQTTVAASLEKSASRRCAHTAGVSLYLQPGLEQLAFGCRLTEVVFAEHAGMVGGVHMVETSPHSYREDLVRVEL